MIALPQHLVVAQPDRLRVAELVDEVGDAAEIAGGNSIRAWVLIDQAWFSGGSRSRDRHR